MLSFWGIFVFYKRQLWNNENDTDFEDRRSRFHYQLCYMLQVALQVAEFKFSFLMCKRGIKIFTLVSYIKVFHKC